MTTRKTHPVIDELKRVADTEIASHSQRFFKTGPGEYGEGDRFLGVRVPKVRGVVKRHRATPLSEVELLLHSELHEVRLAALLILVFQFSRADAGSRRWIYDLYLKNTRFINNWDLVDGSAPQIVGGYLLERSRRPLLRLARSASLWERRIAIMATLKFIRRAEFDDTFKLAEILLNDPEDLIHKAVGWMLREIGNRDRAAEEQFLTRHYLSMPRTMLRYAIERLPESRRRQYLEGRV